MFGHQTLGCDFCDTIRDRTGGHDMCVLQTHLLSLSIEPQIKLKKKKKNTHKHQHLPAIKPVPLLPCGALADFGDLIYYVKFTYLPNLTLSCRVEVRSRPYREEPVGCREMNQPSCQVLTMLPRACVVTFTRNEIEISFLPVARFVGSDLEENSIATFVRQRRFL